LQADAEDLASLRLPVEQRVLPVLRSGKALAFEQRLRSSIAVNSSSHATSPAFRRAAGGDAADTCVPAIGGEGTAASTLPTRCLFESARSGAGERADWSEAARLARGTQLVLAGGLESANVADAVRAVRPFGVDVSSGVERERGVKDAMRIREFIRAAREAERALSVEECR
jgi:hypothetical protein